jgi:hypothetical protein
MAPGHKAARECLFGMIFEFCQHVTGDGVTDTTENMVEC